MTRTANPREVSGPLIIKGLPGHIAKSNIGSSGPAFILKRTKEIDSEAQGTGDTVLPLEATTQDQPCV